MFNLDPIIVGLEIGTSKVCAVVAEMEQNGMATIIGVGQHSSKGVRKGEIVDPRQVSDDLRNAIVEAEQMADVEVRSVFLGVTGNHLRGFNNRGLHPVVSADREITEDDVEDVMKNSKAINLPHDNHALHVVRQHFAVDGQEGILNPVGMLGAKLEANVHVVHGNWNRIQNAYRVVKGLHMNVDDVVFNGLASSLAVLTPEQQELGVCLMDIGGGTTEYVVYSDGVVRHSGVLAIGGDHITNDLSYGLKITLGRAEELKISHGSALIEGSAQGQVIRLNSERGLPERTISMDHLRRIMSLRIEETLELIMHELDRAEMLDYLRAGIVITGGGSRIPGIERLASRIFQLPVKTAQPFGVAGVTTSLEQPEFSTAIGLIKFGAFQWKKMQRERSQGRSWSSGLMGLFRRVA